MIFITETLKLDQPSVKSSFFNSSSEDGVICSCLPACDRILYEVDLNSVMLRSMDQELILIDVHFQYMNMMKYRTDVAFGFLDLLVGFGGVAGLFLGSSLLSLVEIFYSITFGLACHSIHFNMRQRNMQKNVKKVMGRRSINSNQTQPPIKYF